MAKEKGNYSAQLKAEGIEPRLLNDEIGHNIKAAKGSLTYSGDLQPGFVPTLEFTGKVFSLVHRPHNGFANYAIAELIVEHGRVIGAHFLQPMGGFESKAKLDKRIDDLLEELRKTYPSGYGMAVV